MSIQIKKTAALRRSSRGDDIVNILQSALQAVDPAVAVNRFLHRHGEFLSISGRKLDLNRVGRVRLVGVGKAGYPMAVAASTILDDCLQDGVVVVKEGYLGDPRMAPRVKFIQAGHPIPDQRGVAAAEEIEALLSDHRADDLVIALISGGGSALLVAPAPGVSLADLQRLTGDLLACGANIVDINTLRKHLDRLKGGGLAHMCSPARMISLILSDVVGDPLDVIASGLTVPDPTSFQDALDVLDRFHLIENAPAAILEHLRQGSRGELPETPKPGDPLFERIENVIIGNNRLAAEAALQTAREAGFNTLLWTTDLQGEASQAGRELAGLLRQVAEEGQPTPRPVCLVAGGETTVTIADPQGAGRGGRNQELALAAVEGLAGLPDVLLATLATDGGDGPTDAAGAVVSGETFERATTLRLHPAEFLQRHDSYTFFAALDDLLKPGPTQTNVNDLAFLFAY